MAFRGAERRKCISPPGRQSRSGRGRCFFLTSLLIELIDLLAPLFLRHCFFNKSPVPAATCVGSRQRTQRRSARAATAPQRGSAPPMATAASIPVTDISHWWSCTIVSAPEVRSIDATSRSHSKSPIGYRSVSDTWSLANPVRKVEFERLQIKRQHLTLPVTSEP